MPEPSRVVETNANVEPKTVAQPAVDLVMKLFRFVLLNGAMMPAITQDVAGLF